LSPGARAARHRRHDTGRLLQSSAIVGIGTALSRVTGFLRVAAIAYALGVTATAGVYSYANETPNIVYELLLGGVLTATLVPQFVRHLQQRDEDATSAVVTVSMLALVAITIIGILLAPLIVDIYTLRVSGPGRAEQQELATKLLRLFMPQMLFYGFTALATALLRARRRFAAAAFAPVLNNVVVIAIFLALPRVFDGPFTVRRVDNDTGLVLLLGLGTTAGVAAMALALIPALRGARVHLRFLASWKHAAVRTLIRLSGWTFGYVVANQIALWVVLVLANGAVLFSASYLKIVEENGCPLGEHAFKELLSIFIEHAPEEAVRRLDARILLRSGTGSFPLTIRPYRALLPDLAVQLTQHGNRLRRQRNDVLRARLGDGVTPLRCA
jgi:putative peptidoglycan lipid II flippase